MWRRRKNSTIRLKQNKRTRHGLGTISNAPRKILTPSPSSQQKGCWTTMKLSRVSKTSRTLKTTSEEIRIKIDIVCFAFTTENNQISIQFCIIWMLNISGNFQSSTIQAKKKIESMQSFERFVKQIYENKVTGDQMQVVMKTLQVDFGYGSIYSVIRQSLQNICKNYRSIIHSSALSLAKRINNFYKMNRPAYAGTPETSNTKFLQIIVNVIYYHFLNIAQSNVLVCELWDLIKAKTNGSKNNNDFNIRTPQLKLSILNLLALKELIPPCDEVSLTDFRSILQKLNSSFQISCKQNIQKLLDVYRFSDGVTDAQSNLIGQMPHVKSRIEQDKEKQKQKQKQKSKEKQKEKHQIQLHVQKLSLEDIDESNWLQKAKENPIAKKLCSRLNGMFCKDQDKKANYSQSLAADMLIQKLLELQKGEQSPPFHIIRTSTLLREYEKLKQLSLLDDQQKSGLSDDIESMSNKKKKKNKNKKKKQKQEFEEEPIATEKCQTTIELFSKVNQNDFKDYLQTIRFLKELKIDDTKRAGCLVERRKIEEWKKIVQIA